MARDGLEDSVLPAGNEHGSAKILWLEGIYSIEHAAPSFVPPLHDIRASSARIDLELPITMPAGLFSIGGKKICPAGSHIPRHVLYKDCNAVRIRINETKNIIIADLRKRLFCKFLVAAKVAHCISQIGSANIFLRHRTSSRLTNPVVSDAGHGARVLDIPRSQFTTMAR